jgi:WD40 repeat protein
LASTISVISVLLLGLLVVRVLVEASRTRAALHEVVQEKDSQILANAQIMASADPTRALAMVSRLSSDPAAWRSARSTLGMIQRNGIPTSIAELPPDEVAELVRSGDIFIASGPNNAWVIDPEDGLVRHQALPSDAQRISTRHWLHWRAKELFALDVVTGEEILARSFDAPPEQISASSDGRVVAAIDAKKLRVWVAGELVATRSDVRFATVSPDGTHLLASEGPKATPSVSYLLLADLKVEQEMSPTGPLRAHHIGDNNDVFLTMSNGVQVGWPIGGGSAFARCAEKPRMVLRGSESGCVYRGAATFGRRSFGAIFGIVDMDVAVDRPIATAASSLGRAQVWNYKSDIGYSLVHSTGVRSTAMDKSGLRAFTLSSDGRIRRWDVSGANSQAVNHVVHTAETPRVEMMLLPLGIVLDEEPTLVFADQAEGAKSSGSLRALRAQSLDSAESRLLQLVDGDISAIRGGPETLFAVAHAGLPSGVQDSVVAVYRLKDEGPAELVYRSALPSEVTDLEFCKDAAELIVGTRLGAVYRVGKSGAKQIAKREGAVTAVAGTSSRVFAAWSDLPGVVLIDSAAPDQEATWTSAHGYQVVDLDISRNGRKLVSASSSSTLLLWKDGEARVLARIAINPLSLRLSADERAVFVSTGSLASIVDLETGTTRELDLYPGAVRSIPGSGQYAVVDTRSFMLRVDDSLPYDPGLLKKWVQERLLLSGHRADEP